MQTELYSPASSPAPSGRPEGASRPSFSQRLLRAANLEEARALTRAHCRERLRCDEAIVWAGEGDADRAAEAFCSGEGSALVYPLWSARGLLGAVQIRRARGGWSSHDREFLRRVVAELAFKVENLRLESELQERLQSGLLDLAKRIEAKDRYTGGHTKRVFFYVDAIAAEVPGLTEREREQVGLAGLLHDIGKIGVSDEILNKPASLTFEERSEMQLHVDWGYDMVSRVSGLEAVADILRHHHERWDGGGYPLRLREGEIPRLASIVAVADTFDAITTSRPYRAAQAPEVAREEIARSAGTQFDPTIVEAFLKAYARLAEMAGDRVMVERSVFSRGHA